MIENQSDNVEKKEENVSDDSNVSESSSVIEDKISEDKESLDIDGEKIYTEDLKNGQNLKSMAETLVPYKIRKKVH